MSDFGIRDVSRAFEVSCPESCLGVVQSNIFDNIVRNIFLNINLYLTSNNLQGITWKFDNLLLQFIQLCGILIINYC